VVSVGPPVMVPWLRRPDVVETDGQPYVIEVELRVCRRRTVDVELKTATRGGTAGDRSASARVCSPPTRRVGEFEFAHDCRANVGTETRGVDGRMAL